MFMYTKCQCLGKPQEYKYSNAQLASFEERLKIIAVKARIQILLLLADSPHCVCDISAHTGFSQSLASHHLADLMKACLVESKKEGKYVEYFLNANGQELLKAIEHVSFCCEVDTKEGGVAEMKQDKHDCDCEDKKEKKCCEGDGKCDCKKDENCGCEEEAKAEDMSKEDLLAKKAKLEESLNEVNEALAKTK